MKQHASILTSFRLSIHELTFIGVTSAALGLAFWGWTAIDVLLAPVLESFGFRFLFAGFWLIPGIFAPFIIRKPGVALLSSLIAAFVEGMLSKWGLLSIFWGLSQGLGSELIFVLFRYRYWRTGILYLASLSAALASYALSYYHAECYLLSTRYNLLQVGILLASSLIFSAYLTQTLIQKLGPTGLLKPFAIADSDL